MSGRCARRAAAGCGCARPTRATSRASCFNYMSHPGRLGGDARLRAPDARDLRAAGLRSLSRPRDPAGRRRASDDAAIDAFIRAKVESAYHPSCTCRMGTADDPMAVVDPETRVIGVEGLRVVDSSIMPVDHDRQSQRADHHDRREGGRPYPRPRAAAGLERALLRGAGLGDGATVASSESEEE